VAHVPRATPRVSPPVEGPLRERSEVPPLELQQELPAAPAPPLVPVLWGTLWVRLPAAVPRGQPPGMCRPEQRQQALAGQLQEEPL